MDKIKNIGEWILIGLMAIGGILLSVFLYAFAIVLKIGIPIAIVVGIIYGSIWVLQHFGILG